MDFNLFVNLLAALFSFFVVGAVLGALFSKPIRKKLTRVLYTTKERLKIFKPLLRLDKSIHNPILQPGKHLWTGEAVLNPAAAVLGGRTHLVYRAIGADGVSRLGYASSPDGVHFDERLSYPIYAARNPHNVAMNRRHYSPIMYPSGGSWGGCEDPRMVVVDGWVYVTFNMFDNWTLRVAVIAMREEDFLKKRFHMWEGPIMLSHGKRDKNWVLFPEKIGGQFAILHSILGEDESRVRVEYSDDLESLAQRRFESPDPQKIPDRLIAWHVHTRSAGPPPLRTDKGWLVLYHANDAHEPNQYKVGAMLLDLVDPSRVLYRAIAPVISPDEHYENNGKPGIVYACGAVVRDGTLFVYYGGADKVVCVASTPLNAFVDAIIAGDQPELITFIPAETM
ncbi:MAG: hypothetical protein RLZZ26_101 [Candidatus Parcubacteria bacterium]|jgi:predicted GH43/DUF377 family glycosyl hydrolase